MVWLRPLLLSLVLTGVAHAVDEAPLEPEGDNGAGQEAPQTAEAAPPETPDQSADGEENGPEAADNPARLDNRQMAAPGEVPTKEPRPAYLSRVDPGEVITLEAAGDPFFGLRTEETTGAPLGAVILIPDRGTHPDWPDVIGPLRRGLPAAGWTTLAIEAPAEPSDTADMKAYLSRSRARIRAAAALLSSEGNSRLALLGHGSGAILAADYGANVSDGLVGGLVFIGITDLERKKEPPIDELLRRNGLPVLDVFGSRGLAATLNGAPERAEAGRRGAVTLSSHGARYKATSGSINEADRFHAMRYRQLRIVGADHAFTNFEGTLIRRVRGWLQRHVENGARAVVGGGSGAHVEPSAPVDDTSPAAPGEQAPPMFQDLPSGEQPPPMFQQGAAAENGAPPPMFDEADTDETPPASRKGETTQ